MSHSLMLLTMNEKLPMAILRKLLESYATVLIISLFVGLTFPETGGIFTPYITPLLQIIFFLSSLKLDIHELKKEAKNFRPVIMVNLYMLVLFPIATTLLAKIFVPDYALPL